MKYELTIIIPAYNEEDCIKPFIDAISSITKSKKNFPKYCLLFIDDGSNDDTLKNLIKYSSSAANIKYISFSRNFGKESAIYAGLKESFDHIGSKYYVLMDADLQDPPSLLSKMIDLISNNNNIERVATRRCSRQGEPVIRSFFARMFYKLMNKFSQVDLVDGARDYQIMTKKYVKALLECGEYNRFFKGLSQ